MNKNQKNKKRLFTLLLMFTFVVGLIPLGIRGAKADELTQPLEQMVILTTGEQLNEVEVSEPDESKSSEKNDQEIEVENSELPEKEALESNGTKEEEKPAEEAPFGVKEKPAEETYAVEEQEPIDEIPSVEKKESIEEAHLVEEKKPIGEPVKPEKEPEKNTIAEYTLPVGEQPIIILPKSFYQGFNVKAASLEDTIEVDKSAIRKKPGCRTFEVTLDITGTPQNAPVDVVLVIDRSGSMNDKVGGYYSNTRLYYAKQAAINFAGRVLGPNGIPGSRVSVVSFSGPISTSGYGYQNQASTDLDLSTNLTTVTNTINGIKAGGGTNTEAGFIQGQTVIQGATSKQNPNSNKVVIMLTDGLPTASNGNIYRETTSINHVHIQSAIAAGKNIHESKIADVFTIGLTTGMDRSEKELADNILTQAQNKGYYPAPSATDLDKIFGAISKSLGYAATDAKVVDKIGDNFDLVLSSLPAGVTYDSETREIKWNPGTIVTSAQLKYTVQAKPGFPGGLADTNEFAKLTYKDILGTVGKTKDFPEPKVNVPTLIKISLTDANIVLGDSISLGTGTDSSGENYMSPVEGGDNDGENFTYEWRVVGEDTIISTDKNPEVSPIKPTSYEVTVTDSNGCKATATMTVFPRVAVTKVEATKTWVGGPSMDHTAVPLDLYRNVKNGQPTIVNGVTYNTTGKAPTFNYTWENLPKTDKEGHEYIYSVKEKGVTEGKVVINGNEYIVTQEGNSIKNTYLSPKTDIIAKKIWKDGFNEKPTILLQLFRNGSKYGSPVSLVSPKTTYKWENLDKNDNNGETYIYTVDEVEVPEHHVKEIDDLTVTNTHKTGILKVSKKVTGNFGDKSKFFDVVVTFIPPEGRTLESPIKYTGGKYSSEKTVVGQQVTIEIKHGETIEFKNVPYGVKYVVKEKDYTSEKFETEHKFLDADQLMNSKEESVEITNTKEIIIDTGISLDSLPYIIILILLATGGIGRILWKRKQTQLN